jgi:hypothetical protein
MFVELIKRNCDSKIAAVVAHLGAVVAHCWEQWWLIGGAVVAHFWEQWWLIDGGSGGSFGSSGGSLLGAVVAHCWEQWVAR